MYAAIALVANFPVFPGDRSHLNSYTNYDIVQTTWFLAYTPYAILHLHNPFYTDLVNYPTGVNLAQNTGMPLLGLVTAPLTMLVSPVASLNLLRWLAFTLSAYAAYWVFKRIVSWNFAALVGGLLYGISPYMITQGSLHLNLTFVPLPPLILYAVYELVVTQRESARRWGLLLGTFIVAQFFISAEVLATTAIVAFIAIFYLSLLCVREVPRRLPHLLRALPFVALVVVPLLGYPIWYMVHGHAHYTGPAQGYVNVFNADLLGPIVPTLAQLTAPRHLAEIGSNLVAGASDLSENGTYLGIPLIGISVYLVVRFWRKLWPLYLSLLISTIFLLSLGPKLIIDGRKWTLPFNLPFRKMNHLPLLENLLPVRFSLYVLFFVTLLVVLGLDWIHEERTSEGHTGLWLPVRSRHDLTGQLVGWIVTATAVLTLLPAFPYHSYRIRVNWAESKKGLAIVPTGSRVLAYPYPSVFADTPMLWQALSQMRFKLYGGYVLVPSATGEASLVPPALSPTNVQAMLENSVSPSPVPGIPSDYATSMTLLANEINVVHTHNFHHYQTRSSLHATIDSVNMKNHTLIVWVSRLRPILVKISNQTRLRGAHSQLLGIADFQPGQNLLITGRETTGTVNPKTERQLREFIINNRVQTVVVDLGLRDSSEIAHWFTEAIGKPSRAGAGGEIWLDATAKAQQAQNGHPPVVARSEQTTTKFAVSTAYHYR